MYKIVKDNNYRETWKWRYQHPNESNIFRAPGFSDIEEKYRKLRQINRVAQSRSNEKTFPGERSA